MLLRRVIEHVREQNWTAVGIDFVIVVIGVFVGIQVSNWNEERETRQRGAGFTERLRTDLDQERRRYDLMTAYYSDVRDAASRAVAALEGSVPLSNPDLLVNAYRATQYTELSSRRSTFDELVSTGSLGLIADPQLRVTANSVYRLRSLENVVSESLASPYRRAFRQSIAYDLQRELSRSCGDRRISADEAVPGEVALDYACTLEVPVAAVDAAADTLRADPAILAELRLRLVDLETRLADMARTRESGFEGLHGMAADKR